MKASTHLPGCCPVMRFASDSSFSARTKDSQPDALLCPACASSMALSMVSVAARFCLGRKIDIAVVAHVCANWSVDEPLVTMAFTLAGCEFAAASPHLKDMVQKVSDWRRSDYIKCIVLAIESRTNPSAVNQDYVSHLQSCFESGAGSLDRLPAVAQLRAQLRQVPGIDWDRVFGTDSSGKRVEAVGPRRFYGSRPLVRALTAIGASVLAIAQQVIQLPAGPGRADTDAMVEPLCDVLLLLCEMQHAPVGAGRARLASTLEAIAAGGGFKLRLDAALPSKLFKLDDKADPNLAQAFDHLLQTLIKLGAGMAVGGSREVEHLRVASQELQCILRSKGQGQADTDFALYEVAPIDRDSRVALLLGSDVSCCMAPDGTHRAHYFARLAGAWLPICVRRVGMHGIVDPDGSFVATVWCLLCLEPDETQPTLLCDYFDLAPEMRSPAEPGGEFTTGSTLLGDEMIGQLIATAVDCCARIGARRVLVPQTRGRCKWSLKRGDQPQRFGQAMTLLAQPNPIIGRHTDYAADSGASFWVCPA